MDNTITLLDKPMRTDIDVALENLAEAFSFTIVDRCDEPTCVACSPAELPAAA